MIIKEYKERHIKFISRFISETIYTEKKLLLIRSILKLSGTLTYLCNIEKTKT